MNSNRLAHLAIVLLCSTSVLARAQNSDALPAHERKAVQPIRLAVAAQPIAAALNEFARQSGLHVVIGSEVARGVKSAAIEGTFTPEAALQLLLENTGLTYEYLDAQTVAVMGKETPRAQVNNASSLQLAQVEPSVRAGQSSQRDPSTAGSSEGTPSSIKLEEIIVTAQKRRERLIDVPQSMSVLSADYLKKINALQFRDFANTVPGLSFTTQGAGNTTISLRGVTTGSPGISPTVGIYVDEVPYGSSTAFAAGAGFTLDAGLFDLDRIEVLRGPQGTLYGASTMGGLIKYVTKQPDAARFGVDAQTGISSTRDGGISYNGAATVNAPIVTDKAALRATGFYSRDGGYIDNLARGEKDVNRSDIYGGRADLLLTPTDDLTVRITAFIQDIARDGQATADYTSAGAPVDGSLDQRRAIAEPLEQRFRLVSGKVSYDLQWASLTSISSYNRVQTQNGFDLSDILVPILNGLGYGPYSALGLATDYTTEKFTQEIRFASEGTKTLEWLIGGFYAHETSRGEQGYDLRDLAGQPAPNDLFTFLAPSRYEEFAAFGDLTWHLTDRFDVAGGIRYAHNRQEFEQTFSGLFGSSTRAGRSSEDVVTYLANARYHFSDHATGYLRYATGYRPGGPNFASIDPTTGRPVAQESFEADRLKNYEGGFKAQTSDGRFGVDLSGYYIDWSNIQIAVFRGGFGAIDNAPGGATIRGTELTLTAQPTDAFAVTGAFAYQDAKLSDAIPDLGGAKGQRLPDVPRFTAAVNADYELPVGSLQPTVGATLRYVDDRRASLGSTPYRLPDYVTVDLRAGFALGSVDAQIYVHNLLDEYGQLSQAAGRVAILQPRTIGISVTTHF